MAMLGLNQENGIIHRSGYMVIVFPYTLLRQVSRIQISSMQITKLHGLTEQMVKWPVTITWLI